jgi:hypothetical protein
MPQGPEPGWVVYRKMMKWGGVSGFYLNQYRFFGVIDPI